MSAFAFTLGPIGLARRKYTCVYVDVTYGGERRPLRRLFWRLWWLW